MTGNQSGWSLGEFKGKVEGKMVAPSGSVYRIVGYLEFSSYLPPSSTLKSLHHYPSSSLQQP